MGKVLVIEDLDEAVLERLKLRAAENDRPLEEEARAILGAAVASHPDDFWDAAARMRADLATRYAPATPIENVLREMRDMR